MNQDKIVIKETFKAEDLEKRKLIFTDKMKQLIRKELENNIQEIEKYY